MPIYSQSIEGLDALIDDLMRFGDKAMPMLDGAIDDAGNVVLEAARNKVPVKSGVLKNSLRLKRGLTKGYKAYTQITWGADAREYGAPLELGHAIKFSKKGKVVGHVEARPFLRPAADENQEKVADILTDGMNKAIEKLGGNA